MPITPTEVLQYEVRDRKAYITMNRPEAMNALNGELMNAMAEAFTEADLDDDVLVVILTGAGGRAFSAGGDLKDAARRIESGEGRGVPANGVRPRRGGLSPYPNVAKFGYMRGFDEVWLCSKPVIAAIDGHCLAGGLEVALYCDIRLATRKSRFAMPEPKRHLLSGPAFVHLSRMIPMGEALKMELTGDAIDAERAYQACLIQGIYEDRDELMAAADAMADVINVNSPIAVQFIKRLVKEGRDMTVDQHWRFSEMFSYTLQQSEDALEGPKAFAEKREPRWSGR